MAEEDSEQECVCTRVHAGVCSSDEKSPSLNKLNNLRQISLSSDFSELLFSIILLKSN